jgi:mannitol/fructose-specific phosphotransferase system IIA component (Ntr-type)
MLSKLFSTPAMDLALRAGDQESVFRELIALVAGLDDGARAGLLLALLGRERLGSTGLGRGVALPHTRYVIKGVTRPQIVFGRHHGGINYGALDGQPVKLFFLLVAADVAQHLQMLSRLSRLLRDARLREELLFVSSPQEVLRAIQEAEQRMQSAATPVAV